MSRGHLPPFAQLFDDALALVIAYEGPEHLCCYVNPKAGLYLAGKQPLGRRADAVWAMISAGHEEVRFDEVFRSGTAVEAQIFEGGGSAESVGGTQGRHFARHFVRPWRRSDGRVGGVLSIVEGVAGQVAEQMRQEAELALFKKVAEASPDFIGICDAELNPVFVNPAGLEMVELGLDEARHVPVPAYFAPDQQGFARDHVLPTAMREGVWQGELQLRRFASNGARPILYSVFRVDHPITGRPAYLATISRDLSAQKEAELRSALLMRELDHRVKNSLSVVQAIAAQTFGAPEHQEALQAFEGRLLALSGAHHALAAGRWQGAELGETVRTTLARTGCAPERVTAEGPEAMLTPRMAQALAVTLHELTTNAMKYGALSVPDGRVGVTWTLGDEPAAAEGESGRFVSLTWKETEGPAVSAPASQGFGTKLIQYSVAAEDGGRVEMDYRPEGLVCRIRGPVAAPDPGHRPA